MKENVSIFYASRFSVKNFSVNCSSRYSIALLREILYIFFTLRSFDTSVTPASFPAQRGLNRSRGLELLVLHKDDEMALLLLRHCVGLPILKLIRSSLRGCSFNVLEYQYDS